MAYIVYLNVIVMVKMGIIRLCVPIIKSVTYQMLSG